MLSANERRYGNKKHAGVESDSSIVTSALYALKKPKINGIMLMKKLIKSQFFNCPNMLSLLIL